MIKGIIVFNVDVGQSPPETTKVRIEKVKEENATLVKQLTDQSYAVSFMPNRHGNNSITKLPLE